MASFSEKVKAQQAKKPKSQHDRRKAASSAIRDKNAKKNPKTPVKARSAKQLPKGSERNPRTVPGRSAKEKAEQTKAKRGKSTGGRTPRKKARAQSKPANYKPSTGKMAPNTKTSYTLRPGLAKPGANAPSGLDASTKGSGQKASKVKSPVKKPKMQKFNATTSGTGAKAAPKVAPAPANSGPQISKAKKTARAVGRGAKSLAKKTVAGVVIA